MEVVNHTPYPHLLFRTALPDDKMAAAIMLRVTYDVAEDGTATPAAEQVWPLSAEPWECEYGPMESDMVYKRGGVDVFVFGSALAPNGIPVRKMEVRVKLEGKIDHTLVVWGNRVWQEGVFGLKISDPEPFFEMPLTLANAYGGWTEWDGLKFPCPNNHFGKGFYWEKELAIGNPLPNIEDPAHLIEKWDDRPHPVGVVPAPFCEARARRGIRTDETGNIAEVNPFLFNTAFPGMLVNEVRSGEMLQVSGMEKSKISIFRVPEHKLNCKIELGEVNCIKEMEINQFAFEVNKQRAFIVYSFNFNYGFEAHQKRTITLTE